MHKHNGLKAKTVAFLSIGCRTNQEEITTLSFALAGQGYCIVEQTTLADIVIVNTCSVTGATEAKTRRMLHQLKREAPNAAICLTGCLVEQKAEELFKEHAITWVVGNALKHDIPAIIRDTPGGVFCKDLFGTELLPLPLVDSPIQFDISRRTRFSVKIQEGCNFRCAYCIVPFLRGPSRSVEPNDVVRVCAAAIEKGFKELVLTGTHIGQYTCGTMRFIGLLRAILEVPGDFRVRLSSLDPRDISDELIQLAATHPKVCRHLHISVQSLSPDVLKAMNRPAHTLKPLMELLTTFRHIAPDGGIGGDFIVGFPGETEEQFEQTCAAVEHIGFSYGHVFRYSKRPQTVANDMDGQVDEHEKNSRSERLRNVLAKSRVSFIKQCMAVPQKILVEKENPLSGLASNYLRIDVLDATAQHNNWLTVKLTGDTGAAGRCIAAVL
jgi:threonylcarbamoyladenosine tRNA methylthiotransferase MtaB